MNDSPKDQRGCCSYCGSERFPIVRVERDEVGDGGDVRECADCHDFYGAGLVK